VITVLALSTIGSIALWRLSASSTYVSGPHDCHGTTAIAPGWKAQLDVSPTKKLILYGQAGRLEVRFYWKDYSIDSFGAQLARKQIGFCGFKYESLAFGPNKSISVFAPFWLSATILAVYPILAFLRTPAKRWYRRRIGSCGVCGYNLNGNESGTCPECGTAINKNLNTGSTA
jgi:hypothetical protein